MVQFNVHLARVLSSTEHKYIQTPAYLLFSTTHPVIARSAQPSQPPTQRAPSAPRAHRPPPPDRRALPHRRRGRRARGRADASPPVQSGPRGTRPSSAAMAPRARLHGHALTSLRTRVNHRSSRCPKKLTFD